MEKIQFLKELVEIKLITKKITMEKIFLKI